MHTILVYEYLLAEENRVGGCTPTRNKVALLRTCKQINNHKSSNQQRFVEEALEYKIKQDITLTLRVSAILESLSSVR